LVGTAKRLRNGGSRHDGLKSISTPKYSITEGAGKKIFLTDKLVFFKMRPVCLKKIVYVRDFLEVDDGCTR
jgi:hypothetical protein